MITNGDAEAAGNEHEAKERDLKPIETKMVEVKWHCGQRECEGSDEKGAG